MTVSPEIMTYKNIPEKRPRFVTQSNHETAGHYETQVTYNLHTGTHIDAPLHMIMDGATMEGYDISRFIADCRVLDLTHVTGMIHQNDLEPFAIREGQFILLKTRNSWDSEFNHEFVSLAEDGAVFLSGIGIDGVGIDALGIERSQPNHMTHISLLGKGIIILEGLQLAEVPEGDYQLIALPIKLADVEAAPVRAILIEK